MITTRLLRLLSVYFRLTSSYFYAIPFHVDKLGSEFQLSVCDTPKGVILFTLNFSFQCETMIYSFLRLCQMHLIGEYESIHQYVIHGFNLIGFGYPAILQLFLLLYGQPFCDFFNQAVNYDRYLRATYTKKKKRRKPDLLETGVAVIVPFVYLQGLCFGLFSLMKPSKPFFHCSLLHTLEWSIWSQIPVKIYECYMFLNCWHVIVSTWLILLPPCYSMLRWVEELVQDEFEGFRVRERKTIAELRTITHSLQTYQRLYMLCRRMYWITKDWITGLAYFAGKFVGIYMGFATIRLGIDQTLPLSQYLAYPTSCLFLLAFVCFAGPQGEKWHTLSEIYVHQLRWHPKRAIRQSARALLPMCCWISDFMMVKKGFAIESAHDVVVEIGDLVMGTN